MFTAGPLSLLVLGLLLYFLLTWRVTFQFEKVLVYQKSIYFADEICSPRLLAASRPKVESREEKVEQ